MDVYNLIASSICCNCRSILLSRLQNFGCNNNNNTSWTSELSKEDFFSNDRYMYIPWRCVINVAFPCASLLPLSFFVFTETTLHEQYKQCLFLRRELN